MAAVAPVVGPSRVNSPTTRSGPAAGWGVLLAITALAAIVLMSVAANRALGGPGSARAAGAPRPPRPRGRGAPPRPRRARAPGSGARRPPPPPRGPVPARA